MFTNRVVARQVVCRVYSTMVLYTDGSCCKRKNYSGVGVWHCDNSSLNSRYRLMGRTHDSNRSELCAIYLALSYLPEEPLMIKTDSQFSIDMIRNIKTGRALPLRSKNAFVRKTHAILMQALERRLSARRYETTFEKVRAHRGVWGNTQADWLAKTAPYDQYLYTPDVPISIVGKHLRQHHYVMF